MREYVDKMEDDGQYKITSIDRSSKGDCNRYT